MASITQALACRRCARRASNEGADQRPGIGFEYLASRQARGRDARAIDDKEHARRVTEHQLEHHGLLIQEVGQARVVESCRRRGPCRVRYRLGEPGDGDLMRRHGLIEVTTKRGVLLICTIAAPCKIVDPAP